MYIVEIILFPFVWVLDTGLSLFFALTGSMGFAIMLLSGAVALAMTPLRTYAGRTEQRILGKTQKVTADMKLLDPALKGEARFNATEKIYDKHGYHPIQSIGLSASLFIMLPVFIAAIIVLSPEQLGGLPFLFVPDLGAPDALLFGINVLPLVVTGVTIVDAIFRYGAGSSATKRFVAIALILLVLIYGLPSGLVLYWLCSNIIAAGSAFLRKAP
ncbi:YidC/Oxa1 family membrane protein insertase [Algirhabdus cladophorae]|uniref:YidC/Oxa1 family membrane protein insertase n=1 Tax=Algirhabdus cladophorae TaxID=3377108 RepID=UPI003B847EB7